MDQLNATVLVATNVSKKLNLQTSFATTTCHIDRKILTRIMTSDEMIEQFNPDISDSNKIFIRSNFPNFYKQLHIEIDQPVSLNDGINVLRKLLSWVKKLEQKELQGQNGHNNNTNNNNHNDNLQRQHNGKTNTLNNNLCSDSPSAKKQRYNSNIEQKNNESLEDQMQQQFQQNDPDLVAAINNKWHNRSTSNSNDNSNNKNKNDLSKNRLLKKLHQIHLKYVNSELVFDHNHSDPTRERIKKLLNFRVDSRHRDLVNKNVNDSSLDIEIQDEDIFADNNKSKKSLNNEKLNAHLDEFCKEFDDLIENLNTANESSDVMTNTLNLVSKIQHMKHLSGQSQSLFPNIPKIRSQVTSLPIVGDNDNHNQIIGRIKSVYNHSIIGHSTPNTVYEMNNVIQLIQFIYDELAFVWHNNNKSQTLYNELTTLIDSIQVIVSSISNINNSVISNGDNSELNTENITQRKNSLNNKKNKCSNNNNNMTMTSTVQSDQQLNDNNNDNDNSNNDNDCNHDVSVCVNSHQMDFGKLMKNIEELVDKHHDLQDLINECEQLINNGMDMINILTPVIEAMYNGSINP